MDRCVLDSICVLETSNPIGNRPTLSLDNQEGPKPLNSLPWMRDKLAYENALSQTLDAKQAWNEEPERYHDDIDLIIKVLDG